MTHLFLQDWNRSVFVGEFGCQPVSESVGMPSFFSTGFRPYLTTLSLHIGCVRVRLGKSRRFGFSR